ncbi:MAG: hypothetical protein N2747_03065 [Chitinophagaceae bacterium]|nr:hypothetical protein [Chitinophagaceae bacterium]
MDRIESLINQLKEQYHQRLDPGELLLTIKSIEFELVKKNSKPPGHPLGTSRIAVILPHAGESSPPVSEEYKKVKSSVRSEEQQQSCKEVKETFLVEDGSVAIVQKNGQLDMVFNPAEEVPTLAQHLKQQENKESTNQEESLNDKLKQNKTELVEVLKETPVKDLRKAIGVNDRYLFINELFRGDETMYERCIKTINNFNIYAEAEYWINRELKIKLGWNSESPAVQLFEQLVKRRFS